MWEDRGRNDFPFDTDPTYSESAEKWLEKWGDVFRFLGQRPKIPHVSSAPQPPMWEKANRDLIETFVTTNERAQEIALLIDSLCLLRPPLIVKDMATDLAEIRSKNEAGYRYEKREVVESPAYCGYGRQNEQLEPTYNNSAYVHSLDLSELIPFGDQRSADVLEEYNKRCDFFNDSRIPVGRRQPYFDIKMNLSFEDAYQLWKDMSRVLEDWDADPDHYVHYPKKVVGAITRKVELLRNMISGATLPAHRKVGMECAKRVWDLPSTHTRGR